MKKSRIKIIQVIQVTGFYFKTVEQGHIVLGPLNHTTFSNRARTHSPLSFSIGALKPVFTSAAPQNRFCAKISLVRNQSILFWRPMLYFSLNAHLTPERKEKVPYRLAVWNSALDGKQGRWVILVDLTEPLLFQAACTSITASRVVKKMLRNKILCNFYFLILRNFQKNF